MSNYTPSRVFASITTQGRELPISTNSPDWKENNYFRNTSDDQRAVTMDRTKPNRNVQVTAVGEVSLPPDRCRATIRIHSLKDNVADVKNSIHRRLDYALQTLQNHNVKETDMQVHKTMRRVDTMYVMDAEVVVIFLDFHKCQTACNLLVEKLDETVTIGVPEFYHASTTLETLRQQASLLAVHNAKQKAQEMARFVHLAVGKPISMQEEESKEWEGQIEGVTDMEATPTLQQRMSQATVTVSCKINVNFELKPKVKTKS